MSITEKGEIYLVKNKVSGKCYIGQAMKYVSSEFKKWGAVGRWKSHVREAISHSKDHCLLLNQAIRKYGEEAFEVKVLCECDISEMNECEIAFIKEYNSMVPNGYNLKSGGAKGKDSEETRKRKSEAKKKRVYSDDYKISIKLGQRGIRRNPDDVGLPDYICASREKGKIVGYVINKFYTNTALTETITMRFKTLEQAIEALDNLKVKYSDVMQFIDNFKNNANKAIKKTRDKKLPNNMYSIVENEELVGFYVEGLADENGNVIPRKVFRDYNNKKNFELAKDYLDTLPKPKIKATLKSKLQTV